MLGGHFCDVMLGLITEPLRFCVINRFLGFFSTKRSKIRWNTVKLFRFEAASIQDMVTKFEPNLGFEKSFISVLALKVSVAGNEIQENSFRRIAPNCKGWEHFTSWILTQTWTRKCWGESFFWQCLSDVLIIKLRDYLEFFPTWGRPLSSWTSP